MSTPDPLLGATIGQYEVVARIGGGGMGVVYAARDTTLNRRVALKFLPPQWSHDAEAKERFIREAQAASAIEHPHICTIHHIGETADGRLFIVMPLYEGQTLKQRLAQGLMPVDEAIEIAAQVAEGLAKAHAHGVIHRDIKPGNIMLTEDGVRVLDFGLAKLADAQMLLTREGSTLGTVAYMSPEQTRGDEADTRSDVWAIGVVLYEMLAGHAPFKGGYPEAIAHAIKNDPPLSLREAGREVPEALEQIVFRALHKIPAVRFQSARELARALRQLQGRTLPIELRTEPLTIPMGIAAPLPRRRRPRRAYAVLAVVAAVLLIGGPAWVLLPADRTPVAVAPVANNTPFPQLDAYRLALTAELVHQLGASPVLRPIGYDRMLEMLRPFRDNAARDIAGREALQVMASNAGATAVLVPSLVYEDGSIRARVERRDPQTGLTELLFETAPVASSLIEDAAYGLMPELALGVQRAAIGEGSWRTSLAQTLRSAVGRGLTALPNRFARANAAAAFERGLSAYEQGEYATAHAAFASAASLDPRNPLPLAWQARVSSLMRRDSDAASEADAAARLSTDTLTDTDRRFVEAMVAEVRGRADEARAAYESLAGEYDDDPVWHIELAGFEDRLGQTAAAIATYQRLVELEDRARVRLELCRLHSRLNEAALARDQGQRALDGYVALGNRGGEAQARWCLTDVLRTGTDSDRRAARQHAEAALQIVQELDYPFGLARAHNYVALVALTAERDGRAAAEHFELALAGARDTGNVFLEARVLMNLGVSYEMFGAYARAIEHYEQSQQLFAALGSEQEAAWQQVNAAAIRIEAGIDPPRGLVEAENALAVFQRIGDRAFEVHTRRVIARQLRFAGNYEGASQQLTQARNLARQYDLQANAVPIVIDLASLRAEQGDYAEALALLDGVADTAEGLERVRVLIERGRVQARLGDFARARATLAAAQPLIAADDPASLALLRFAQGELAHMAGQPGEAHPLFTQAVDFAPRDVPALGTSEERAYLGLLEALQGRVARGREMVTASLTEAAAARRVALEARCRLFLARIEIAARRFAEARGMLTDVPSEAALGLDLRAQLHYWRSAALAGLGLTGEAASERAAARRLVEELRTRAEPHATNLLDRVDLALIVN